MAMQEDIEIQLWKYIDGQSSPADKERISVLITNNAEWKAKYEALMAFHAEMKQVETSQPSMRFSQNIMDAVADVRIARRTDKYLNHWLIKGIAAFLIIAMTGMLGYAFANTNWETGTGIDYSKWLSGYTLNAFILVYIVLALIFLDSLLRRKRRPQNSTEL